jgi:CyaY protein
VITPNSPVRQIWISALATSFKLDLVEGEFILSKTGERLIPLVARLVNEQSQDEVMSA